MCFPRLFVLQNLMKSHYSNVKLSIIPALISRRLHHIRPLPTSHLYAQVDSAAAGTNMWQILQTQHPLLPLLTCLPELPVWGMWSIISLSAVKSKVRTRGRDDVICLPYGHTGWVVCVLDHAWLWLLMFTIEIMTTLHSFLGKYLCFFHVCEKKSSFYNLLLLGLPGVYLTDSQELSPPGRPADLAHKPKEKAWWPPRLRSVAPRDLRRGPDNDQYHPHEPKTNLLKQDVHHVPTKTVVINC